MQIPKENRSCYASGKQREILIELFRLPEVQRSFFLTGGTALSVFYLSHRISNDIDLFTIDNFDFSAFSFILKIKWSSEFSVIKESGSFISSIIGDVKVDFVHDPLSLKEKRPKIHLEHNAVIQVDSIRNIVSNKLCTIVSRTEPKDFIDFYFLFKLIQGLTWEQVYKDAQQKEAIFDDAPTAAYQIEENFKFVLENTELIPRSRLDFDKEEWSQFYRDLIQWTYSRFGPDPHL